MIRKGVSGGLQSAAEGGFDAGFAEKCDRENTEDCVEADGGVKRSKSQEPSSREGPNIKIQGVPIRAFLDLDFGLLGFGDLPLDLCK